MRRFTQLISCAAAMILFTAVSVSGQFVPPAADVAVVNIAPGSGVIEEAINGDTLVGGIRINPTRIYELEADGFYTVTSRILFGGSSDTTSTLTIVGATGGKKPIVLTTPLDGGDMFTHSVTGSLVLKNLYWPSLATNSTAAVLFSLAGSNQRLVIEDFFHENQMNGDVFSLGGVQGVMDIYIKNSYFRDMTQFANPWNYAIFTRGDGKAIDTLWVENLTVANGGLLIMNKFCPVNFGFFNHNTIQNIPRYWNFMEQWKEAYFTNNLFINCLWMGEAQEMMLSQLESQSQGFPMEVGIVNVMRPNVENWELGHGVGSAPAIEDVKWMASNNVHFTSPFLDNYYGGGFSDTTDVPVSWVDWGFSADAGLALPPHLVGNVPARFTSPMTDTLVDMYPGIILSTNHIQVDPGMNTVMIADQAEGDAYAHWARANYALDDVVPARSTFTIGDYDPTTIPGPEGENGTGIEVVSDLVDDFTYTADIVSTIDGMKLGAQEWWGDISDWDSEDQLAKVKAFYLDPTVGIDDPKHVATSSISIYPNPATGVLHLESENELSTAIFYDMTGRAVKRVDLHGNVTLSLDVSTLNKGIFVLQVETVEGATVSSKFIKE
jgi:hypothetical protein